MQRFRRGHGAVWMVVIIITFLHFAWIQIINVKEIDDVTSFKADLDTWIYSNESIFQPDYILTKDHGVQSKNTIKVSDLRVYRDIIYEMFIGIPSFKRKLSPIVHFDLSKDPVKINYLRKIFAHLNYFGAKSVMLQYDDSFPFAGNLSLARSPHSYTIDDVKDIIAHASKSKLNIIPYIQVIGQMEYLLQHHQFHDIRSDSFPRQTICPCSNRSVTIIKEIIRQIMDLHKNAKAIHIGGHDFYNSRLTCNRCKGQHLNENQVYVEYIVKICKYIKQHFPEMIILIWDNRLRSMTANEMEPLKDLVEPMVLDFHPDVTHILDQPQWKRYKSLFHQIWGATAYKGAEECDDNFVPTVKRLSNTITWARLLDGLRRTGLKVGGISLMGFSRPTYSLPTCQILPASIPTLLLMALAVRVNAYHKYVNSEAAICTLRCNDYFHVELTEDYTVETCSRMPARQSYRLLSILRVLKSRISNLFAKLGNNRNLLGNQQYKVLVIDELIYLQSALKSLNRETRLAFKEVYYNHTIEEWHYRHIRPLKNLIDDFYWHMLHTRIILQP
ncbi:Hexosaminidase D [Trichoplax sp. H2]|nr:Hexosaminidase D [Trichoplax sp. H2]|eukprot:RDD38884.1 Hexosaminidase D [Trichoplax sp. H2]